MQVLQRNLDLSLENSISSFLASSISRFTMYHHPLITYVLYPKRIPKVIRPDLSIPILKSFSRGPIKPSDLVCILLRAEASRYAENVVAITLLTSTSQPILGRHVASLLVTKGNSICS